MFWWDLLTVCADRIFLSVSVRQSERWLVAAALMHRLELSVSLIMNKFFNFSGWCNYRYFSRCCAVGKVSAILG